ncbi:lipopolysaccharide biosynthesis protein [Phycicoccus sonneratiae]|uniref:Membrane protein involved in the export of O-antigen and teichoic acid n=1 Tax=Phycicoccus sonneratiae TaxID=2807628 RepID=A0ABS2CNF0_9MICO|nr:hypothetical protein [Phycicoccus sonneraticus]MBM6400978.1 hypothetical protein [Phycicoccus sonneraticus]
MSSAPPQPEPPSGGPPAGGLRDHAALSTYATAVQGAARLAYSVVIGRLGSRELLGQANSALSISVLTSLAWAAPAANAGTRFVALRRSLDDEEGALRVARHIALRSLLVATVLPTTTGLLGARWLGLAPVQVVASVVLCWAYSVYVTTRGIRFGLFGFRQVALWDTIAAATSLSVLAVVLVLDLDLLTLLPLAVGYALFAVATWPARAHGRLEKAARREVDQWIAFSAVGVLASGGLLQASQLAAHHWGGEAGAGDFAAALSLATPMSMFSIALITALVPPLVAAAGREDHAAVTRHSDAIARRLVAIFVGAIGVLVIVSPLGISVVYGASFTRSATVLPVLLGAVMLTSVALGGATALQSTRRRGPQVVAAINLGGLVLGVATWFVLAPSLGVDGVALGYLVGAGCASLGTMGAVWWLERQSWADLVARLVAGVVLVAVLAVATRGLDGVVGAVAQLGAAAVFAAAWWWLNRREVASLWATLRGGGGDAPPS